MPMCVGLVVLPPADARQTFDILDAHTWFANVSTFAGLGSAGPTYKYEYSTRAAYGAGVSGWGASGAS